MSDFRDHLDWAKRDYLSRKYPGNLADDALPGRRRIPWTIIGTTITGLAAALLFWLGAPVDPTINRPTSVSPDQIAVGASPQEYAESMVLPDMPEYFEINPAAEELAIPAIGSFPSVDYAADYSAAATTQESA
ncbi:MAG: hypothetical protein H0U59_06235 [Gemmatimonadaceae bacterium]|nr:hypothetical protein [Gemmatimonadaceae bacterium]